METYIIEGLTAVVLVSLVSFAGASTLVLQKSLLEKTIMYLTAFATGALLGAVFFHLLPEAIEQQGTYNQFIASLVLIGMLFAFILEKGIHWHHHHTLEHKGLPGQNANMKVIKPYVYNNLIGDGLHNLVDGLTLAVAFFTGTSLGIIIFISILIHELAQEFGDFAILIKGGLTPKKALTFNFLSALTALVGFIIGIILVSTPAFLNLIVALILPLAAGNFLYLSAADLIPELHEEKNPKLSLIQLIFGILGVFIMYLLTFVELA